MAPVSSIVTIGKVAFVLLKYLDMSSIKIENTSSLPCFPKYGSCVQSSCQDEGVGLSRTGRVHQQELVKVWDVVFAGHPRFAHTKAVYSLLWRPYAFPNL